MSSRSLTALHPAAAWGELSKNIGTWRQYALVLVVTALAVAISVVAFMSVRAWHTHQALDEFNQHVSDHAATLQGTLRFNLKVMWDVLAERPTPGIPATRTSSTPAAD